MSPLAGSHLKEKDSSMNLNGHTAMYKRADILSYFSKSSTAISLEDTQKEFGKLKRQLHDLLYRLGDDG